MMTYYLVHLLGNFFPLLTTLFPSTFVSQIAIFLFAEVLPIWVSVRCGVLNHFSERDVGDNPAPARYQTLPQDQNSIVLASQHNVVRLFFSLTECHL